MLLVSLLRAKSFACIFLDVDDNEIKFEVVDEVAMINFMNGEKIFLKYFFNHLQMTLFARAALITQAMPSSSLKFCGKMASNNRGVGFLDDASVAWSLRMRKKSLGYKIFGERA